MCKATTQCTKARALRCPGHVVLLIGVAVCYFMLFYAILWPKIENFAIRRPDRRDPYAGWPGLRRCRGAITIIILVNVDFDSLSLSLSLTLTLSLSLSLSLCLLSVSVAVAVAAYVSVPVCL